VSHTVAAGTGDISGHYLFRAKNENRVEVLAYNGRVFSSCPMPAAFTGETGKPFTVEAKRVNTLLGALKDDAVLDFSDNGSGEITVGAGRGEITLSGLDPQRFPFWDDILETKSTKTASISAERIAAAISHSKTFIFEDDAKTPQFCVAEVRDGCLLSTDLVAVSIVKMGGLENSSLRIFGKDSAAILSFLGTFKAKSEKAEKTEEGKPTPEVVEPEVEIWENEKAMFLKRGDGAVFGESKFDKRFPDFKVDWTAEDDYWVELTKDEVKSAVGFLSSGAAQEDTTLRIQIRPGKVVFSMKSSANGKPMSYDLPVESQGQKEKIESELPESGFAVSNVYILRLLGACVGDKVRFGIAKRKDWGWIRVQDERGPDHYVTTVTWKKIA
jgi:DNA polymerase III sliding clamp (beta) subunit (PCNA family)